MNHQSDHDAVEARLHELGSQPVDPEVRATHLQRATVVPASAPKRRFGPLAIGAAAVMGFLAGSAGLASAGALPDPAQNVAHDVLGVVKVEVPEAGNRGACVSKAAKIDDKAAKQAAKDACPKGNDTDDDTDGDDGDTEAPGQSGEAPGKSGEAPGKSGEAPGQAKHADDPCRGKSAWAGRMSREERAALKEAFDRSECVDDDSLDEVDETEIDEDN